MKTDRFVWMLVSLLIVSATVLAACAPAAAPTSAPATEAPAIVTKAPTEAATEPPTEAPVPVTLQYWHTHSDPETAQLDQVIASFEAANPGLPARRAGGLASRCVVLVDIPEGAVVDRVDIEGGVIAPA